MKKELMESMLRHGEYRRLISELEKVENASEYEKLILSQAYLFVGEKYIALESVLKLERIIESDSCYRAEIEKIKDAILEDKITEYIEKWKADFREEEIENKEEEVFSKEIEELFKEIIGMEEARKKLQVYLDTSKLNKERKSREYDDFLNNMNHFMIAGNRGSGKTTLAEHICKLLNNSEKNVQYLFARDIKERESVERLAQNKKKVIIIENIEDLLLNEDVNSYFRFDILNGLEDVISQNLTEDGCRFILTGKEEAFEKIKRMNPMLETMFFDCIHIEKYTVEELWQIINHLALEDGFRINPECEEHIKKWLSSESKLKDFTNTIALTNLLKEAKKNLAVRYRMFEEEEELGIYFLEEEKMEQKICRLEPEDFIGNEDEKELEQLCNELDRMIGLSRVKKEVKTQIAKVNIAMKAAKAGANRKNNYGTLHMAFVGEPGTGKTMVAEKIGKIYCALGILPGNEVHIVSRADLVSQYIGGTARCVREVCQRADGGVLFIDEAYSLVNNEQDSYGKEAVDTLIQEMENRRDTMMVILAGYEQEIMRFFKSNPGFKSRVPNIIHFENYELEEMIQIFEKMVHDEGYYLTTNALSVLSGLLEEKAKEVSFGNARGVRNVLNQVIDAQSTRIHQESEMNVEQVDYDAITKEDILAVQKKMNTESKTIEELLQELDALEGLSGVKKKVNDMINSMQYLKLMKKRNLNPGRSQGTMHLIFSGNPGTGKTTVASLLGQIYVKLGVLKKNTFVLVKRSDLVAQYMGQTAAKVANKVAEADGGILFIDEAYQLYNGERDSFGEEAIGTLLSLAEEKRDSLMIILAGYMENMEEFLQVNPGLKSRFPNIVEFTDYTEAELVNIFKNMCKEDGKKLETGVLPLIEKVIRHRKEKDNREFANARGVRNIFDQIILKQHSRIIKEEKSGMNHTDEELITIKKADVED